MEQEITDWDSNCLAAAHALQHKFFLVINSGAISVKLKAKFESLFLIQPPDSILRPTCNNSSYKSFWGISLSAVFILHCAIFLWKNSKSIKMDGECKYSQWDLGLDFNWSILKLNLCLHLKPFALSEKVSTVVFEYLTPSTRITVVFAK